MEEIMNNFQNFTSYLEIFLVIILLIFFVLGLAKNWKFTLMEIVFFIVGVAILKLITNNIITSNQEIQDLLKEKLVYPIAELIDNLNDTITEINTQNDFNLPLIGGVLKDESFYLGLSYSIISAGLTIVIAIIALILSLILTSIIYNIINHFLLKNQKYKDRKKKFWYKSIGLAPSLIYGFIFISVLISPLYVVRNNILNISNKIDTTEINNNLAPIISKISEYKIKLNEYENKLNGVETKYYAIEDDVDEIEEAYNEFNLKIKSCKEEFTAYKIKINDINNNPGKLSYSDRAIAYQIKLKFDEYESTIDDKYKEYEDAAKEVDNALTTFKEGKNIINEYKDKLNEVKTQLNEINLDEINSKAEEIIKYQNEIKAYLPDLKIFGFLVIDFGFAKINYNGIEYNFSDSMDQLLKYLTNYLTELSADLYSNLKPKFDEYDKMIEEADKQIDEAYNEINIEFANFSKDEYLKEIEEANGELDNFYKDINFEEIKDQIDELDSKR